MRCIIFNYIKSFLSKKDKSQAQPSQQSKKQIVIQKAKTKQNITNTPLNQKKEKKQDHSLPSHILHKEFTVSAKKYGISNRDFSQNAQSIVNKLSRNGFETYLVGGCVRDLLLGKKPKDIDIATNARPEEIKRIFGRQCRLIGRRFRLAHIICGREIYEVATFRGNHDNANEKISKTSEQGMLLRDNVYGSLREDAERRDFSVNALYLDIKHNIIFDFFNGIDDLKQGKLRLIGDPTTRYHEDPVRMLRAIRFMAKLDMFLDKPTQQPIYELAHLLNHIPAARLFDESLKLLQSGNGVKTYELLCEYQLFNVLFPTIACNFTHSGDSNAERMIVKALTSTDERIRDNLRINPAFLYAALLWYPMREKMDELKNEGGLNTHDAMMLASNEILAETCKVIALHRRHTSVIRDIWQLQFKMTKRVGKRPYQTLEHIKFRAGFDLLVMRAEIEGGDLVELSAWWHEFQLSNEVQRAEQLKNVKSPYNGEKKKRKPRRKKHYNNRKPKKTVSTN